MLCSSAIIWSLGSTSGKQLFPALAQRLGTTPLLMVLLRLRGSDNYSESSIDLFSEPSSSTAITWVPLDQSDAASAYQTCRDWSSLHLGVVAGAVRVIHVPTTSQFVDIFMKGLFSTVFLEFGSSLNVYSTDISVVGVLAICSAICR